MHYFKCLILILIEDYSGGVLGFLNLLNTSLLKVKKSFIKCLQMWIFFFKRWNFILMVMVYIVRSPFVYKIANTMKRQPTTALKKIWPAIRSQFAPALHSQKHFLARFRPTHLSGGLWSFNWIGKNIKLFWSSHQGKKIILILYLLYFLY